MFPKGFAAAGLHCGIAKKKDKKDFALFYSKVPAVGAGLFTSNSVKAAPVLVSAKRISGGKGIRAIAANSGCANACTGARGLADADTTCSAVAGFLGVERSGVLVASTGVIGAYLPMEKVWLAAEQAAAAVLSGKGREADAVAAIMTTDTKPKTASRKIKLSGGTAVIWGCAKGAGMIHPDLKALHATMLSFILTDADVSLKALKSALGPAAEASFNRVSVDSDTSTNDTLIALANGVAGNKEITPGTSDHKLFSKALAEVCLDLAKMIAADGEGATKLVEVRVLGARSLAEAKKAASVIATSPLVKTALFGNDANWGRILAAAGRSGACFDANKVEVCFNDLKVVKNGVATDYSEARASKILKGRTVVITVDLKAGTHRAYYYTCDYSLDYIKINADYRS